MIMAMVSHLQFLLTNEAATQALGACIAKHVTAGFKLYLQGDLGAGKSTLTRAILRALGVTGTLRSPSYALVEPYDGVLASGGTIHHFDFYRMDAQPLGWRDAGFAEAFEAPHAAIVEWPQYAKGLPAPTLALAISADPSNGARQVLCMLNTENAALLKDLQGFAA